VNGAAKSGGVWPHHIRDTTVLQLEKPISNGTRPWDSVTASSVPEGTGPDTDGGVNVTTP
jgi:hypothetical protein